MTRVRDSETGRFVAEGDTLWQGFMQEHPCVMEWLKRRGEGTKKQYGRYLLHFCEKFGLQPERFLELDRIEARDLVWKHVSPLIEVSRSTAKNNLAALKSFYRSKDGEILPFDSRRGGKHHFDTKLRKKAAVEHVPDKQEMYRIIDATTCIRDKAMFLMLFQSGIRKNALVHLKFKHVQKQLYGKGEPEIPLRLRITADLDTKLRGYSMSFYETFLQGEAVEALKAYCDTAHQDGDPEKPLFMSKLGNPMSMCGIWQIFKRCAKRAGFDSETLWVHTVRKAFKRLVRFAAIDEDFKEAIMGHVLPGSRENYFSRSRSDDLREQYMRVDFSRTVPATKTERQAVQIREQTVQIENLKKQVETLSASQKTERQVFLDSFADWLMNDQEFKEQVKEIMRKRAALRKTE